MSQSIPHPLPVDWWLSAFNVAMATVWAPLAPAHPTALLLLGVHLGAATLPWLLARAPAPRARALRVLYELYPFLWTAAFWTELDLHTRLVDTLRDDRILVSLDRALFGAHLNETWLATMHATAFSELMHFIYFCFYPLLLVAPLVLIIRGTQAQLREGVLRFVLAYLGCILVHAWWPTTGPAVLSLHFPPSVSVGWFFRLNHWIQNRGDSVGTAFPSTHVAGAVTFAWIAWRFWPRRVAIGVTALAAGIMGATIYTQNHFAVDSLAGALIAVVLQAFVVPMIGLRGTWGPGERAPGENPGEVPS